MKYYTTDEILTNFNKEKRNKIARLIWKKPVYEIITIPIMKKEVI